MECRDHAAVVALLAPAVLLHSPVLGTRRFEGREAVGDLLGILIDRFERWECYAEFPGDEAHVLLARARIGGFDVEEAIVARRDDQDRICELRVFGRPLSGVAAFAAVAAGPIARQRGRARAALMRGLTAPMPSLLAVGDRVLGEMTMPANSAVRPKGQGRSMRLEGSTEIAAPIETVFSFVADPLNDPQWCPRVIWCRQRGGDRPGPGARYEAFHNPTFRRKHTRWIDILEFDAPTRLVSKQEDEIAAFTISYLLEPTARGARITQRDEITWKVPKVALPIAKRIVQRHLGQQLRTLKQVLETNSPVVA